MAGMFAVACAALVPAPALGAPVAPTLAITSPAAATFTSSQSPLIKGTSTDSTDSITLLIYAGAEAIG